MTRTPITLVREHVEAWRRANDWSRETLVQQIVEAHERLGFAALTGIRFDPPTRDTFERMRVNADKVYRWLDDSSKDRNLLTLNFLWPVLAAMPMDRRLALASALLAPVDLMVHEQAFIGVDMAGGPDKAVVMHFRDFLESTSEAQVAMANMLDRIDQGEPEAARVKLSRTATAVQRAIALMNRLLRRHKIGEKP